MRQLIKPIFALVGGLLTTPLGLLAAVALGPVILGVLCAAVFGFVVFAAWSALLAAIVLGRRVYFAISERPRRDSSSAVEIRREI